MIVRNVVMRAGVQTSARIKEIVVRTRAVWARTSAIANRKTSAMV